ncbi:MAG: hypothetical protein NZ928_04450 [Endomicrobia bacterium]|nr:hypothetical protein [Endomicrobiia bacterium]MCX7940191.1 hypothetical protein [Endomicrobiia bacterium]MDW8055712.1 hypothetical protein [Elusimicrobiota bacterium]
MDPVVGIVITVLGTVASVSGVGLFVFNGTKRLIKEIAETTKGIKEIALHQTEVLNNQTEMLNKQTEMLNKQTEMLNKQTEMLNNMSMMLERQSEILDRIDKTMVEEFRAIRAMLERIDRKIPDSGVYVVREK